MSKRNRSSFIDSDSDEKSNDDLEEGLKKLANKKVNYSKNYSESSSDSENEEWNTRTKSNKHKDKKRRRRSKSSDVEDGEVTDSSDGEMFIDGLDKNLIGDAVDREALKNMNEVQRETEIFNRVERREVMQTRFEIEKKLRAKRKDEQQRERRGSSRRYDSPGEQDDRYGRRRSRTRRRRYRSSRSSDSERGGGGANSSRSSSPHHSSRRHDNHRGNSPPVSSSSATAYSTAAAEFSDGGHRHQRSDRRKNMERGRKESKHTSALEDLKMKREEKKKNSELMEQKAKLKASDVYSDDDDDDNNASSSSDSISDSDVSRSSYSGSESESESDNERQKLAKMKMTCISELKQLNAIRLSRFKMEKWCHMPFFSNTIRGCYVRIGIGSSHGKSIYRFLTLSPEQLCEIMDVVPTGKVYQLGTTRTNKGLKLKFGQAERIYRLEFVSNTDCTDEEFERWKDAMTKADLKLPTIFQVEQKQKQIKNASEYTFNENDIQSIIESKKKFKKNPTNYAIQKTILMKSRDMAEVEGNSEKKDELQQELDELEERASELDRIRSKNISSVSYINQRNRMRNYVEAEEAAKQDYADMKEYKQDPFTRRRCRPTLVTKTKEQLLLQRLEEERRQQSHKDENLEIKKTIVRKQGAGYSDIPEPTESKPVATTSLGPSGEMLHANDLFSVHNFDINIDVQLPITSAMELSTKKLQTSRPLVPQRRSLNLTDYKKRKGLI